MDKINEQITVSINEAVKLVGVSAATIRNWEKAELITPVRHKNGYRMFTMQDIERLRLIKEYSIDKNISIAAIKSLIGKDYTHIANKSENVVTKKILGEKWKDFRIKRGLSLAEVAKSVGITSSYLSKIESAQANTSFEILENLATFYGENVLYYFQQKDASSTVLSSGKTEKFSIGLDGVSLSARNTLADSNLTVMTYTIEPLCGRFEPSSHHGEEFVYILDGQIDFTLDEKQIFHLKIGDSLHYKSNEKHQWMNPSKSKTAKMLWVYTKEDTV